MSDEWRFCVVTPNYNMAEHLKETIESVLGNLQSGDEYYIVDGGSTDGSQAIIQDYGDGISGWVSEPDEGYADAIDKGFRMSSTPLMCWINSGDLLLGGSLDLRREAFARSDIDLSFGDDYYIDEQGLVLQHTNGRAGNLKRMMLHGGWTPLQDACSWRRSLYDKAGGIDASFKYAADYDLLLRMSLCGKCRYMPAVLSAFRRHVSQKSIAHAGAYKTERERCRRNQLASRAPLLRFVFVWKTRLRGRVPAMDRRRSPVIGRAASGLSARYVGVSI